MRVDADCISDDSERSVGEPALRTAFGGDVLDDDKMGRLDTDRFERTRRW